MPNPRPRPEPGTDTEQSRIRPDGLRYESKTPGTSFAGAYASNMSCLICGRHRPRAELRTFRLAGALQYRCKDPC